jgi:hypothetical protein
MLIYFMAIRNILRTFGIVCDHLVQFVFILYIFPVLVSCTMKNLATLVGSRGIVTVERINRFNL